MLGQVNPVTSQQPTTTITTKKNFNWKNILLGIIIGAVLVGLAGITFWYFTRPKESETSHPQEESNIAPCDINADRKCNVADLDLLNKALGTSRGQKGYVPLADLNADGVINDVDKQMLLKLLDQNHSDETAGWKTYTDSSFSFKYPSTLKKENQMPQGSGYTQEFKNSDGTYILAIIVKGNYSQITGQPFSDIGSYIDMKTGVNLKVDGQEAISVCPRAGCENTNDVYFFSKDSKAIIRIILETPKDASSLDDSRTKIFNQILSTFKFL